MDLNVTEAMVRLMSDAMRGVSGAQKAMRSLAELPPDTDAFLSWLKDNVPTMDDVARSDLIGPQIEEWFQMMGFVPRGRYQELLDRYETLRRRIEESEKHRDELQSMLGPQHVANELLDAWGATLQTTLKAQSEFLKILTGGGAKAEKEDEEEHANGEC